MTTNITENISNTAPNIYVEHTPFNPRIWIGRHEPYETERARYWYQIAQANYLLKKKAIKANDTKTKHPSVGLVGFACDQGVRRNLGRVGAKYGPDHIRKAFASLPLSPTLQNKYSHDNSTLAYILTDVGNVVCHDGNTLTPDILEETQHDYSEQVSKLLNQGKLVFGLGGGHAIAYASYMGLWNDLNKAVENSDVNSAPHIGIINFDAHLDIRNAPTGTSGTPFQQISEHNAKYNQPFNYCAIGISQLSNSAALFDRADALNVNIISDNECYQTTWETIATKVDGFIGSVDVVYLTIDMDVFPSSVVPAVSAPAAKGIPLDFFERCIAHIFKSGKVRMVDFAEINPTYDIDGRSAKVTAHLLAQMVEAHLLSVDGS